MLMGVKGAPLIKTFCVAIAVFIVGMALRAHMVGERRELPVVAISTTGEDGRDRVVIPFEVVLSARAKRVVVQQGDVIMEEKIGPEKAEISGFRGKLRSGDEAIFLQVEWRDGENAPRYFAKLRLDLPELDAVVHVFESTGDIDDVWEMP